MRALFSLLLTLSLLPACGPSVPPGDCSETAKVTGYRDEDSDGHGDPATKTLVCEVGIQGWVSTGLDCDDTRADVNPDMIEACDGLDNDCDNQADEGLRGLTYYEDSDLDGFGNIDRTTEACTPPPGFVENSSDCDDDDPLSYPGSEEFCDGKDNNCNGLVDDDDPDTSLENMPWWYRDGDGDSYGDPNEGVQRCEAPDGTVDNDLDCNDDSIGISPDALEVCDAIDNDCDGLIDDSDPDLDPFGQNTWYYDLDGDGYGDAGVSVQACNQPWFYVGDPNDCDDSDEFILDGASTFWAVDGDGDGYGDLGQALSGPDCNPPAGTGYTPELAGADCDDTQSAINPGASEICDGLDNDCDGLLDDADDDVDLNTATVYFLDVDLDGYGTATASVELCTDPGVGYSIDDTDCDDGDIDINPGAPEICNGNVDDDCNGLADEADPGLDPTSAPSWFVDFDGDGWGDPYSGATVACTQPSGLVDNDLDCDDNDPAILGDVDWLTDTDGDGFGVLPVVGSGCIPPNANTAPDLGQVDCDDTDQDSYPGADEICGDGTDQDCNGVDQTCPGDTCFDANNAVPLTSDTRYVHDLSAYTDDIAFLDFNTCTNHPTAGADAIMPVQIAPGDNFSAYMVGADDASLYLLDTCNAPDPAANCMVGSDNLSAAGAGETLWYANLGATTETLFLVADCNGNCSTYELVLDFDAFGLADTCAALAGREPLTTGGYSYNGSLDGFADNSDLGSLGCTGIDSSGGEAFLPVELQDGETLDVLQYSQILDDSSVYVMSNCADPFGTCLVGADNVGAGQPEALAYSNASGSPETVYLALDCYLPTCRDFTAKIAIE